MTFKCVYYYFLSVLSINVLFPLFQDFKLNKKMSRDQQSHDNKGQKVAEYMRRQHLKVINRKILKKKNPMSGCKRSAHPTIPLDRKQKHIDTIMKQYPYVELTTAEFDDIIIKEHGFNMLGGFVDPVLDNDEWNPATRVNLLNMPPAVFQSYFQSSPSHKTTSKSFNKLVEHTSGISTINIKPMCYLHQMKIVCKESDFGKVQETINDLFSAIQTSLLEKTTMLEHYWHGQKLLLTLFNNGMVSKITFPYMNEIQHNKLIVYAKSDVDEIKRLLEDDVSRIVRYGERKCTFLSVHGVRYRPWGEIRMNRDISAHKLLLFAGQANCILGSAFVVKRPEEYKKEGIKVYIEWYYGNLETLRITLKPRVNCTKRFRLLMKKVQVGDLEYVCRLIDSDTLEIDMSHFDQRTLIKDEMKKVIQGKLYKIGRIIKAIQYVYQEKRCTPAHIEFMEKFIKDNLKNNCIPKDDVDIKMSAVNPEYPVLQTEVTIFDRIRGGMFMAAVQRIGPRSVYFKTFVMKEKFKLDYMYFTRESVGDCKVYSVVKSCISKLKEAMQKKRGAVLQVDVLINRPLINVDLCAKEYNNINKMRNLLQNITRPTIFSHITDAEFYFMTGAMERQLCTDLRKKYQVVIEAKPSFPCFLIYGPPRMKTRVIEELELLLTSIRDNTTIVLLSSYGCEEVILYALEKIWGPLLWRMKSKHHADRIYIDTRQYVIHVHGNNDILTKLKTNLSAVAETLNDSDKERSHICVACYSTTDEGAFVLYICGHVYCNACIKVQINIGNKDRNFPIFCAAENCGKPICLFDIKHILSSTITGMDVFIQSAVELFMTRTQDKYRFCPTPDCKMIYYTDHSVKDRSFVCSLCKVECCRACHSVYHQGLSCLAYQLLQNDSQQLTQWMVDDPDNRDVCPKCYFGIEKNEGCDCIFCIVCKISICWKCKKCFDTERLAYIHIRRNCIDPE